MSMLLIILKEFWTVHNTKPNICYCFVTISYEDNFIQNIGMLGCISLEELKLLLVAEVEGWFLFINQCQWRSIFSLSLIMLSRWYISHPKHKENLQLSNLPPQWKEGGTYSPHSKVQDHQVAADGKGDFRSNFVLIFIILNLSLRLLYYTVKL